MRHLRITFVICFLAGILSSISAQDYNSINEDGEVTQARKRNRNDEEQNKKSEIPRGMRVWTVDEKFGDITPDEPDTLSYMFMNTIFTTGKYGEYNTTGNLGAIRQNRIFTDRPDYDDFIFDHGYDYFLTPVSDFHFTSTYSPITNLSLNSCGNRTNGEDHFKALFAVNAGKRIGLGFKFDYLYGRGYYQENSASLFNYSLYGSYLGDRYQAHFLFSTNHQKQTENGGITNDDYITSPERFNDSYTTAEIPTMLERNWNRNDNLHLFYTHRYSFGFNRKVPMTEEEIKARKFAIASQKENNAKKAKEEARRQAEKEDREFDEEEYDRQAAEDAKNATDTTPSDTTWTKNEYVPVTSFIHTAKFDNSTRIYQAYYTPENYYADTFNTLSRYEGDSLYDKTRHTILQNTFAIALLEGFNKYAKAGLKGFLTHEFKQYTLPDMETMSRSYNEQSLFAGGQISKTEGNTVHYNATGEIAVAGASLGDYFIDATADLNFPLFGDTIQLAADGFIHHYAPTFYYTKYHSRHFWWDNDDMKSVFHTRVQGRFSLQRTKTQLRVAVDDISNYVYFGTSYTVSGDQRLYNAAFARQSSKNISVLTASLDQKFRLGPVNLEAQVTYQKSTHKDIIPLPALNAYANLYLRFKIAHVLDCDLGADARYFTKYYAPDFVPGIAQFAVQENEESKVELGNYPIVNVYANFFLKHARFFVMMSHVNHSGDGGNAFLVPHYPINQRVFRFGISWNFFN
ncbi:MAG: hypothetical protein IKI36_08080 [Prevotella sp.]|nr:hypothetical protein [Prevotella sp.]